eukprot:UN14325
MQQCLEECDSMAHCEGFRYADDAGCELYELCPHDEVLFGEWGLENTIMGKPDCQTDDECPVHKNCVVMGQARQCTDCGAFSADTCPIAGCFRVDDPDENRDEQICVQCLNDSDCGIRMTPLDR